MSNDFSLCRAVVAVLALALQACSPAGPTDWSGYVEGEYIQMAAPLTARLKQLPVQAGQQVQAGAELFLLEGDLEQAQAAEAEARVQVARAQQANLETGRRPPELAVTQAQRDQVAAQAAQARRDLVRVEQQAAQGFVSPARVDEARTLQQQTQSRLAELDAALVVARLPARTDERQASRAGAQAAEQALRQVRWRESQTRQLAPVAAEVAEVYYRVGELVSAGQPVLALLPADRRKARFFVPETEFATLQNGQAVELSCDGCGAPMRASITRMATQPEYAPPVIYSNTSRARLVFMVEARPAPSDALRLMPGQPVQVRRIP